MPLLIFSLWSILLLTASSFSSSSHGPTSSSHQRRHQHHQQESNAPYNYELEVVGAFGRVGSFFLTTSRRSVAVARDVSPGWLTEGLCHSKRILEKDLSFHTNTKTIGFGVSWKWYSSIRRRMLWGLYMVSAAFWNFEHVYNRHAE